MPSQASAAAGVVEIADYSYPQGWRTAAEQRAREACAQLEGGAILLLPGIPYDFPRADIDFLLQHQAEDSRLHKNVSYRPSEDLLRGFGGSGDEEQRVHGILRNYSRAVTEFAGRLLATYAGR